MKNLSNYYRLKAAIKLEEEDIVSEFLSKYKVGQLFRNTELDKNFILIGGGTRTKFRLSEIKIYNPEDKSGHIEVSEVALNTIIYLTPVETLVELFSLSNEEV